MDGGKDEEDIRRRTNEHCQIYRYVLLLDADGCYVSLQVDPDAYKKLLRCVFSTDINVCEDVPSGAGRKAGAKLTNPIGGTPHQVDGADRYECGFAGLLTTNIFAISTSLCP